MFVCIKSQERRIIVVKGKKKKKKKKEKLGLVSFRKQYRFRRIHGLCNCIYRGRRRGR